MPKRSKFFTLFMILSGYANVYAHEPPFVWPEPLTSGQKEDLVKRLSSWPVEDLRLVKNQVQLRYGQATAYCAAKVSLKLYYAAKVDCRETSIKSVKMSAFTLQAVFQVLQQKQEFIGTCDTDDDKNPSSIASLCRQDGYIQPVCQGFFEVNAALQSSAPSALNFSVLQIACPTLFAAGNVSDKDLKSCRQIFQGMPAKEKLQVWKHLTYRWSSWPRYKSCVVSSK